MSKVTSKLQVTIPKAIAGALSIRPGDEVDWVVSVDGARVTPARNARQRDDRSWRLAAFDEATERQRGRNGTRRRARKPSSRGWTREELYRRGRTG